MNLRKELKEGRKRVGVWGLGYIGFSSIAYFAKEGVRCIGTDVSKIRVDDVNRGTATIPNLDYWLNFDTRQLAAKGMMRATPDWRELIREDVAVHLIAVPTEMNGKPYHNILEDVIKKLCVFKELKLSHPPLVIVESTLTPTVAERIVFPIFEKAGLQVGKDILFGVAPRRDWFTSPDKSLKVLPRVVGGTTSETTELMQQALGIICDTVLKAKDHKHAAIVKSIENAYRQLDITFANQLTLAYPDLDVTSILKLVGTKWNIGTYHPSFGTGGYCIPLAPQYVLEGASHPEKLTLLQESLKTDFNQPEEVVQSLVRRGARNVGILGLTYTGDLKVHVLSPALTLAKCLKQKGISVKIHDPYYTPEEIAQIVGAPTFNFPDGLQEFDTLLIVAGHMAYKSISHSEIVRNLKNCALILDNSGVWNSVEFPAPITYYEAGSAGWLG